jgi:hypothetical protein
MALIEVDLSTRFVIRLWDKAPVKEYLDLILITKWVSVDSIIGLV